MLTILRMKTFTRFASWRSAARYTAELIAPALGRRTEHRAGRFIRLTTKVQDILGEHQDAIVAASEIEQFLANHSHDDASARAARHLLETQHQAALSARAQFFDSVEQTRPQEIHAMAQDQARRQRVKIRPARLPHTQGSCPGQL